ncbi:MAG: metallophosphoesterase [Actinomycetota bacterium]
MRPGAPGLQVLHLADSHLTKRDRRRADFIAGLPQRLARPPDLILATGDMIEDDGGIDLLLASLEPLRARLGLFYVLGSHDYYQARFKAPTKYFRSTDTPTDVPPADVERLEAGLKSLGWGALTNRSEVIEDAGRRIRLAGVDDPYLRRQRTAHIERRADEDLAIGLTHAPDVVSEWLLNGFDLVLAGHTHGGQVRLPLVGAVVTNSALPAALAMGLSSVGGGHLHVSPGLGTSKYTPIRFLCRPAATLLHLHPGSVPV